MVIEGIELYYNLFYNFSFERLYEFKEKLLEFEKKSDMLYTKKTGIDAKILYFCKKIFDQLHHATCETMFV